MDAGHIGHNGTPRTVRRDPNGTHDKSRRASALLRLRTCPMAASPPKASVQDSMRWSTTPSRRPRSCSRRCAAKTMTELCREHDIADSVLQKWREQFLAAGAEQLSGETERTELDELRAQVSKLERALGRKTMEVEVAGELLREWE